MGVVWGAAGPKVVRGRSRGCNGRGGGRCRVGATIRGAGLRTVRRFIMWSTDDDNRGVRQWDSRGHVVGRKKDSE